MPNLNLSRKNKKAQVWALDLAIGLMVFVMIIFLFYRYSVSFVPEQNIVSRMVREGRYISNSLLINGTPPGWEEITLSPENLEDIYQFGLITDNTLDPAKWTKFCDWSENYYSGVKEKFGTQSSFFIQFFDNMEDFYSDPPVPRLIPDPGGCSGAGNTIQGKNPTQLVKIERLVAYKNESNITIPLRMVIYLWSFEKA
ncbi:MAG: hypothetical protein JSW08_00805 [archaeon]|nr:MAG: hypothetical protein JSW08_00805 [archaeon]